ncbi:VOC family protein [Pseudomonas moorei]|uniref:VOC family protein n=1 Tax=Pseudomonas moorei TaxID=395599 RepID=UPI001FF5D951|nr:VOC family protein [Pseudomonas moorei]
MAIKKLAHYSIRTNNLEASLRFYTEVLSFRSGYRPAFPFPGLWLYIDEDESEFGAIHLIGVDANSPKGLLDYLGERKAYDQGGTGALDHIAFLASDWQIIRSRCLEHGVPYSERVVPDLGLLQVFLTDPSGLTIELNFPASEHRR